ncbi:unnamed protein product [Owenia fusiformis]|uniref:Uncharacterized protein n=1 Tax=Owenia fusiformis TaxID=6347 RepID=A0A8S4PGA8_OWEFU|nr:unnamed protein product [Owenia fusiformis]
MTILSLTSAILLLFSLKNGAAVRDVFPIDPCERALLNGEIKALNSTKTNQNICKYYKKLGKELYEALLTCDSYTADLIQEWVLSTVLDLELAEPNKTQCDHGVEKLYGFLTSANKEIAAKSLAAFTDTMVTFTREILNELTKDQLAAYTQNDSFCTITIAWWNDMATRVVKYAKGEGATVTSHQEMILRGLGLMNVDVNRKLNKDFPTLCSMTPRCQLFK